MPIFVQTDTKLIDVEKIAYIDLVTGDTPTIYFTSGHRLVLSEPETASLVEGIEALGRARALVAHRAPHSPPALGCSPAPPPAAKRVRRASGAAS